MVSQSNTQNWVQTEKGQGKEIINIANKYEIDMHCTCIMETSSFCLRPLCIVAVIWFSFSLDIFCLVVECLTLAYLVLKYY